MSLDLKVEQFICWNRDLEHPVSGTESPEAACLLCRGFVTESDERPHWSKPHSVAPVDKLLARAFREGSSRIFESPLPALSFVIWDSRNRRLQALSDPIGAYPLFVRERGREVTIATSIELILDRGFEEIDRTSVAAHLCGIPPEQGATFFRNIRMLAPGSLLTVDSRSLKIQAPRTVRQATPVAVPDDQQLAIQLKTRLLSIVPSYAPKDQPIGITLSSGLDSTTIAAVLRNARPQATIVAFVWTSKGVPAADESGPAGRVARALGLDVVEVDADIHGPLSQSGGISPAISSPVCNVYQETWLATFALARQHGIEVLLTGHGGDLAFGTVFPFADLFLSGRWRRLAQEIRCYREVDKVDLAWLLRYRLIGPTARWLFPRRRAKPPAWLDASLKREVPLLPDAHRFALPGVRRRKLMIEDPRRSALTGAATREAASLGVDLRHPWLDPSLLGFAATIPSSMSFSSGLSKAPVRRAMRGLLPGEILDRQHKIYPTALFRRALQSEYFKVDSLLRDMRAADLGFVDSVRLRRAVERYREGDDPSSAFWNSLTLEAWLRKLP